MHRDGESFDVRRIKLYADGLIGAVDFDVAVESRHIINARFVADVETWVLEKDAEEMSEQFEGKSGNGHTSKMA